MTRQGQALTKLALSLIVSCLAVVPALAAPGMDYFSHVTPSTKKTLPVQQAVPDRIGAGSLGMMSPHSPALSWFESFDKTVYTLQPTDQDKIILKRPFNQEAERVQQWTQTAAKVAKNYRLLAMELKTMTVPAKLPGIKDYRDFTADWYSDKAGCYEDLIRPRPPAKTVEELEESLKEIEARSRGLADTEKSLHEMDEDLRKTYKVHLSRTSDDLWKYVHGSN